MPQYRCLVFSRFVGGNIDVTFCFVSNRGKIYHEPLPSKLAQVDEATARDDAFSRKLVHPTELGPQLFGEDNRPAKVLSRWELRMLAFKPNLKPLRKLNLGEMTQWKKAKRGCAVEKTFVPLGNELVNMVQRSLDRTDEEDSTQFKDIPDQTQVKMPHVYFPPGTSESQTQPESSSNRALPPLRRPLLTGTSPVREEAEEVKSSPTEEPMPLLYGVNFPDRKMLVDHVLQENDYLLSLLRKATTSPTIDDHTTKCGLVCFSNLFLAPAAEHTSEEFLTKKMDKKILDAYGAMFDIYSGNVLPDKAVSRHLDNGCCYQDWRIKTEEEVKDLLPRLTGKARAHITSHFDQRGLLDDISSKTTAKKWKGKVVAGSKVEHTAAKQQKVLPAGPLIPWISRSGNVQLLHKHELFCKPGKSVHCTDSYFHTCTARRDFGVLQTLCLRTCLGYTVFSLLEALGVYF